MPLESQPLTRDQANVIWVLRREVGMHGAEPIPELSKVSAASQERRRLAREATRGGTA